MDILDILDIVERAPEAVERRVAQWPAGWSMMGLLLIGVVVVLLGGGRAGDVILISGSALVLYARRHFFWRDLRTSWFTYLIIAGVFACPVYAKNAASKPGDPAETVGERTVGSYKWRPFDATTNGTAPLPMYDQFVVTMKPGARILVRPTSSKVAPGIFVVQVDGDARIEVKPGVRKLVVAGKTAKTSATLLPGTYDVKGNVRDDTIEIRRAGGEGAVQTAGGARVIDAESDAGRVP